MLQALDYLKRESCTRLGIVFPEANALALSVAEDLRRLGIPFDDGTGSIPPGIFERRCWQSWIALQEEPGIAAADRVGARLRGAGRFVRMDGSAFGAGVADVLENALGESLVDDLNFLARHLEENSNGRRAGTVADFLRRRIALPKEATFAEFLAQTLEALEAARLERTSRAAADRSSRMAGAKQ